MALAHKRGVRAISVTDHDTIDGLKELLQIPPGSGPEWVSGVEISCEPPLPFRQLGSIHLLGYGFSIYDRQINQVLEKAQQARHSRNPKIIDKLNGLGIDITLDEVERRFGAGQTGRPHIAEMLREKGVVQTFDEAFDKYLAKGKPAYVNKYKISCEMAITIIRNAGGLPVLAHPGLLEIEDAQDLESFVDILSGYGLEGMEVYYTDHDDATTAMLLELAQKKDLLITGGSDFHGSFNLGVEMGTGTGNLNIGYDVFRDLQARLEALQDNDGILVILEDNIGYRFKQRRFLENALCHRSFLNENQDICSSDNERLEFLGDAVLGLCIGHMLMKKDPARNEGSLSKMRSNLVSEPALAQMARNIDLGRFVRLGKGEALSGGSDKNSILSDAFEALIAAIYLDAGFDTVHKLVAALFNDHFEQIICAHPAMDYKSTLQEYAQERGAEPPRYDLVKEVGPDHDKTFEVSLNLFDIESKGLGKTKKAAEQDAAKNALELFERTDS